MPAADDGTDGRAIDQIESLAAITASLRSVPPATDEDAPRRRADVAASAPVSAKAARTADFVGKAQR